MNFAQRLTRGPKEKYETLVDMAMKPFFKQEIRNKFEQYKKENPDEYKINRWSVELFITAIPSLAVYYGATLHPNHYMRDVLQVGTMIYWLGYKMYYGLFKVYKSSPDEYKKDKA